jgi:putative sigma-54 modulation protein
VPAPGIRPLEAPMQITVTFRHVDPTPALRSYAEDKVTRVAKKYLRRPIDAHVILAVSKERHVAEITLQADHVSMFAKETTHDLYSAIDLAVEKLEHQAQKLKARRSERKGVASARAVPASDDGTEPSAGVAQVVETRRVSAKPMSLEDAVGRLERSTDEFLVFTHEADQRLAVLYRRKDGRFGLIQAAAH